MVRSIRFLTESFTDHPGLDTAVSRALLLRASEGALPETFRLHIPGRIVAFGKRDTLAPGYAAAVGAARAAGFTPVERLAGGRAAVFHEGTLAFSWTIPTEDPRPGISERFSMLAGLMVRAFGRLGIEASVGEVSGEYCPGAYSVNHAGRIKLMGVGQRLARHAAHVGGVVVVTGAELARTALLPVYAALDLDWDPSTVGSLEAVVPSVTPHQVDAAIRHELAGLGRLEAGDVDSATLALAEQLAPEHLSPDQPNTSLRSARPRPS